MAITEARERKARDKGRNMQRREVSGKGRRGREAGLERRRRKSLTSQQQCCPQSENGALGSGEGRELVEVVHSMLEEKWHLYIQELEEGWRETAVTSK